MPFAINYSHLAADLYRSGDIPLDYFKCPAWEDLVGEARAVLPSYIHFPLIVGRGDGVPIHGEKMAPVDFHEIEALLNASDTTYINIHLNPLQDYFPDIDLNSTDPADIDRITEGLIRDVETMVRHFGADRVITENDNPGHGRNFLAVCLPQVICTVIEAVNTGFLFDLSHARLSARALDITEQEYIVQLPVDRIREIHITGIQYVNDDLLNHWETLGIDRQFTERFNNSWTDHLALIEQDWDVMQWASNQIDTGAWSTPWIVSLEYGGVGRFWGQISEAHILRDQIPRLYALFGAQRESKPIS